MRAFEIRLNGKRLCVAGLEYGDVMFSLSGGATERSRGAVGLNVTGLLPTRSTVRWQHLGVDIGDNIQVKIIETDTVDEPEVLQPPPRDLRKYEKAAVRRLAKEFGWTIQTGPAKKKRVRDR